MNLDDTKLDDLQNYEEEIAALRFRRDQLYDQITEQRREKRRHVEDLLYDLQDTLEDDEEVTLLRMKEDYGRGGSWSYDETLTSDGVIATDVTSHYGSRTTDAAVEDLSRWPDDEPLDIKDDYLTGDRTRPGYIDKLADRIKTLKRGEDDVPWHRLRYTG